MVSASLKGRVQQGKQALLATLCVDGAKLETIVLEGGGGGFSQYGYRDWNYSAGTIKFLGWASELLPDKSTDEWCVCVWGGDRLINNHGHLNDTAVD